MDIFSLIDNYEFYLEKKLAGRYIPLAAIEPLILSLKDKFTVTKNGNSVEGLPIYKIKIGNGKMKILMWSQMHGNESTTTKALFDFFNLLKKDEKIVDEILSKCELHIFPMLNPDGALAYTRINKNQIDLNRDAQNLSQPESKILRTAFDEIKPDFCFNLHDQRTIFNVGKTAKPATISFLTPAEDEERNLTGARKKSMELIAKMNELLQKYIPGQVGRYDDTFNINCVGDTFQSSGVPTILFEAGHYQGDYKREKTREYIFYALIQALFTISTTEITGQAFESYFDIPENGKQFYDILLKKVPFISANETEFSDVGVLYKEVLENDDILFEPTFEKIQSLQYLYGHKEYADCSLHLSPLKKSELSKKWLEGFLRIFQ